MLVFRLPLLSLCVLAVVAGCAPGVIPEGDEGEGASLINGAVDTDHQQVGTLVHPTSATTVGSCTATLVGTHTVLTASHCVVSNGVVGDPAIYKFRLNGTAYPAKRITAHPQFNALEEPNRDIAMVELVHDVKDLRPMQILRTAPVLNETVVLVGYGRTTADAPTDGQRRAGKNQVSNVQPNWFQMQGASGDDAGVCSGDSGGPTLFLRDGVLLIGGVHSTATCDKIAPVNGVDVNKSTDARVDTYQAFVDQAAEGNLYEGGGYEQAAPTLEVEVDGGTGRRAFADGEMRLRVHASDDMALDRIMIFVNGERVTMYFPQAATYDGELVIPAPRPRADGTIWIQTAAVDRAGRRTNANVTL